MIASGSRPARRLRRGWPAQLALGEHRQRRLGQGEAVVQRRHGDGEARCVGGQERRQPGHHRRPQVGGLQHFQQRLAAARRIGGNQHPAGVMVEEGLQRLPGRRVLGRDRQRRQRLVAQRLRLGDARVPGRPHVHPRQPVELLAQAVRRLVDLLRRQQRPFDVVAALFVAAAGLCPERIGGFAHAGRDHAQEAGRQVVEQGRGAFEEQRQEILDARGQHPGLEVLVERAAARVHVEALAQRGQYLRQAGLVHRHFAAGQHLHRRDLVQRALRFGVEFADGVDVLVQQLDAQRRVGAHRVDIEQATAHGEIARVHHLRHVAVAGAFQAALLRVHVQALADLQVEAAADDVTQWRQPLQQGLYRHHHDAVGEPGQAVQRGQALGNDVRVRTELVVGQGFPVRERHHRQRCVVAQQGLQVGDRLVRAVVVAGDQQQRPGMGLRGAGHVPGQRAGRCGGAPPGAELARAGQRRNGVGGVMRHETADFTAVPGPGRQARTSSSPPMPPTGASPGAGHGPAGARRRGHGAGRPGQPTGGRASRWHAVSWPAPAPCAPGPGCRTGAAPA